MVIFISGFWILQGCTLLRLKLIALISPLSNVSIANVVILHALVESLLQTVAPVKVLDVASSHFTS